MHQPLAQRYFYSGHTNQGDCDVYLLVGLRANEVLLVIPLVGESIDYYISKTVKWQIPLNTKVIGILKSKLVTDEQKDKWNEKVKAIREACKNE